MWQYDKSNDLYHYGIPGMRWGVTRTSKKLARATTKEQRDKAISKLNQHKEKASTQIKKLQKKSARLEKIRNSQRQLSDIKAASYANQAARYRAKQYGRFTSSVKAQKFDQKAGRLEVKANRIKARSQQTQAKLIKNEHMQQMYKKSINDIDITIKNRGRDYLAQRNR